MAQHDYNIANQTGLEFRADLNHLAEAIVTQNSGPTEPTITYAGMKWLDSSTSPPTEKRRNAADDGWETTLTEAGRAVTGATDAAAQRTAMGAQAALVSGTNIKTINGESVLGSGNIALPTTTFASAAENAAGVAENKAVDPLGIREALNATGDAPIFACRAWVNFNGTGTVAIRASGNVSSITDNGTGTYTINLATAMPDANYAVTIAGKNDVSNTNSANNVTPVSPSAFTFQHVENSVATDANYLNVAIFR